MAEQLPWNEFLRYTRMPAQIYFPDRLLYSVYATIWMYNNLLFIKIKNHNMFRPSMLLSSGEYRYLHVYFELQFKIHM
jgi:hypothetical protein